MAAERRRKPNALRTVVVLALLLAILPAMYLTDRLLLNPWSMSVTGKPTLTGHWQGEVAFGPDDKQTLVMHLQYHWKTGPGARRSRIDGTAEICGTSGAHTAELTGKPRTRSGSRFSMVMYEHEHPPGKYLDVLEGEWREDAISFHATYMTFGPDGSNIGSTDQNRLTLQLRRVTETDYERAC